MAQEAREANCLKPPESPTLAPVGCAGFVSTLVATDVISHCTLPPSRATCHTAAALWLLALPCGCQVQQRGLAGTKHDSYSLAEITHTGNPVWGVREVVSFSLAVWWGNTIMLGRLHHLSDEGFLAINCLAVRKESTAKGYYREEIKKCQGLARKDFFLLCVDSSPSSSPQPWALFRKFRFWMTIQNT